jgi:hypothetical protein
VLAGEFGYNGETSVFRQNYGIGKGIGYEVETDE